MRSVTSPNSWRPGIGLKYPTFLGFTAHVPIPSMIGTAIQLLATSSIIRFVDADLLPEAGDRLADRDHERRAGERGVPERHAEAATVSGLGQKLPGAGGIIAQRRA